MYISNETPEQTENRLLKVIAKAELVVLDGAYTFEEFPLAGIKDRMNADALAFVRDEEVWSQLVPSIDETKELFKVVNFHFANGVDNSGFVGWLATELKKKLGTGVFVVCGQNSGRGGIFDYWGCPLAIGESFIQEIRSLIANGKR